MAKMVATQSGIWLGKYDLRGFSNQVALEYGADTAEVTSFGETTRTFLPGYTTVRFSAGGFLDLGATGDKALFDEIGVTNEPFTVTPQDVTVGSLAYFVRVLAASYQPSLRVGDTAKFSLSGEACDDPLVRGVVLHKATAAASSSNGAAQQVGAVLSTQRIYAALHVVAASGTTPTLDVVVQSDDNSGFTSPVSRLTFTQATATTSEWKEAAGPVTDTYWRVNYTISGTTPAFTFVVAFGIF